MDVKEYQSYLKSAAWKNLREKALWRDGYVCQGCREQVKATEVHHLTYEHVTHEFLFELISLCKDCHIRVHTGEHK